MNQVDNRARGWVNIDIASYNKHQKIILFCCLCFFFLVVNITSLFLPLEQSLTSDEAVHYASGMAILSGQPSKLGAVKIEDRNIMPASALNPLVSQAIRAVIPEWIMPESIKAFKEIFWGRIATIIVSLILGIYVFRWSAQLYGTNAGFLAFTLYTLDPNIIAHSRLVTQDIIGACSLFIATYYFWNFLQFGGRSNGLLSMITFGIAQISRYTAIYLIPIYLILSLGFYSSSIWHTFRSKNWHIIRAGIKNFISYSTLLLLTTIIIINIGFSFERTLTKFGDYAFASKGLTSLQSSSEFLRALPIPVPYSYPRGLDFGKYKQESAAGNAPAYLMGKLGIENGINKGFKEYFIIAFLYKVPIATQLILFMAILSLFRDRHKINFWKNEAFLIIPSLFYFIDFSFSTAQIGIRYILMIFPFLFVLSSRAALGWTELRNRYRIFITALIAYLLISNLSYFPHYISYFNELLVDRKMGYTILADSNLSWGQNQVYITDFLNKNPHIKVFNPRQPQGGLVVIEANNLAGIGEEPQVYQWIRENLKPIDHVVYNYLIFDIQPQDLTKIVELRSQTKTDSQNP